MKPLHDKKHTPAKRFLSLLCVLALCLGLLPVTALAADGIDLYVAGQQITESGCYEKNQDGNWTKVDGTEPADGQFYYDADTVTLTLNQAKIVNNENVSVGSGVQYRGSVIAYSQSADVPLTIVVSQGTSTITGNGGIRVESTTGNASLSIKGPGSLDVEPKGSNSGITLSSSKNRNLDIDGADVTASSPNQYGVYLYSSTDASSTSTITVNNGSLTTGGNGNVGIYYYWSGTNNAGTSSLTVSGNAVVDTRNSKIQTNNKETVVQVGAGSDGNGGIVFNGKSGTVYGDVTLDEPLTVGEGETLTIPEGSSLDSNGKLTNEGTIINEGTLIGEVGGSGTVTPKITTDSPLPEGTVGEPYTATLQATGNNITWSVTSGSLPVGLNLESSTGVISGTPTAAGTSTFTVKAENTAGSDSKELTLTINPAPILVTGVTLDKTELTLTEGGSETLTATITPDNASNKSLTWSSSDSSIVTVGADQTDNTKATVKALKEGSATITATTADGNKTATCTVTVKEPPYTGKYSYEVFTSVGDNGTLAVDRYATEGDKVTIDVTPDQAYKLDELVVTANGKEVELTANSDGTYTFTMPSADVRITATFAEDPDWTPDEPEEPTTDVSDLFIDIAPDAWYKDAVQYAYDNGLMTGVSDTEFAPEATTTRAMIVSILARLEGVESAQAAGFADVDDEWYATAVNWAANVGVVNGYEDNTFQPNTAITREQLAAILMNYAAYKGEDVSNRADLANYTDQPSTWAQEAMQWAVAEKLTSGVTNTELQPQGNATRAQVAAILQRFLSE